MQDHCTIRTANGGGPLRKKIRLKTKHNMILYIVKTCFSINISTSRIIF